MLTRQSSVISGRHLVNLLFYELKESQMPILLMLSEAYDITEDQSRLQCMYEATRRGSSILLP
jgi:hypothetical protein